MIKHHTFTEEEIMNECSALMYAAFISEMRKLQGTEFSTVGLGKSFYHAHNENEWVYIGNGDGTYCGFMTIDHSKGVNHIDGIYVMKEDRKKGCASSILKQYFEENPGEYEIELLGENIVSHKFWEAMTGGQVKVDKPWTGRAKTFKFTIKEEAL